jgi:hypothetical protein
MRKVASKIHESGPVNPAAIYIELTLSVPLEKRLNTTSERPGNE